MRRKGISVLLLLSLMITVPSLLTESSLKTTTDTMFTNYVSHEPIVILNDANFTDYGFQGNGSETNPYIIENYNISNSTGKGISIEYTTKHFVIRNCYLEDNEIGIYIKNTAISTTKIYNNTCIANSLYNIRVASSSKIALQDNICNSSKGGSNGFGISVDGSYNSTIENNICYNNRYGLYIRSMGYSNITNNKIGFSERTSLLFRSTSLRFIQNAFEHDGIRIADTSMNYFDKYHFENNTVNGKELGFFKSEDGIVINESIYGQLILLNCTNSIINKLNLSNSYTGLNMHFCNNITLADNILSNNLVAIYSDYTTSLNVQNNQFSFNGLCINIRSNSFTSIENNTAINSTNGFSIAESPNTKVNRNFLYNISETGINMRESGNSEIYNNTCRDCRWSIQLSNTHGIGATDNAEVYNNILIGGTNGIKVNQGSNNQIYNNTIVLTWGYAIWLGQYTSYTIVSSNYFLSNNWGEFYPGNSQAYDSGSNNKWYIFDEELGNYWNTRVSGSYSIDTFTSSGYKVDLFPFSLPDTDSDDLDDIEEFYLSFTDINDNDTDDDLMSDGWEYWNGLDPFSNDTLLDLDEDGIMNIDEFNFGTLPNNNDTDGDFMPDKWEIDNGLDPTSEADDNDDADLDGLKNIDEYLLGTNPQSPHSDSDEMPDGWEVDNNLNPLIDDSWEDPDNDGLDNAAECSHLTDPHNNDTDSDGMPDGWESQNNLNPLVNDSFEDDDHDGLLNIDEYHNNLDPKNSDYDGDGLPDGWEVEYGLNPKYNDSFMDKDDDGLTNRQEYMESTDPTNPDSDGDGYTDSEEVNNNSDPLDPESTPMTSTPTTAKTSWSFIFSLNAIWLCFLLSKKRKKVQPP